MGLQALEQLASGTPTPERDRSMQLEVMREIELPHADLLIMIAPAIRKLVEAAHASGGS